MRSLLPVAVVGAILFANMTPAIAGEDCEKSGGCPKAKADAECKAKCEKAKKAHKKDAEATKKEASGDTKEEAAKSKE